MTASESARARLRVLSVGNVYPPHHLGGYEVIWRGVMRRLRQEGHVARVLVTGYRSPDTPDSAPDDPDVHRELGWYWRDHAWPPMGPRETLALERRNAAIFDRHLAEFRPDVITWWAVGGGSLSLIERARRAGIPALLFVLDPWTSYGRERDRWTHMWRRVPAPATALVERLTGIPARLDLAGAGRWVFCSEWMRRATLDSGLPIADDTVLTPGVESGFLSAAPASEAPPWRWRLLYLGRVVEQKGVGTAIEALTRLPPEATLRIVGPGDLPYRRVLETLAGGLGVAERVSFEPSRGREEVIDVYRAADVVVFPVEWPEPWGLVPLEAMALGRLVVATGRGGSGEYLVDGGNALLFEPGDSGGLAGAIESLARDPDLRERLRAAGRETAAAHGEDEFNRQAVAEIEAAAGAAPRRGISARTSPRARRS